MRLISSSRYSKITKVSLKEKDILTDVLFGDVPQMFLYLEFCIHLCLFNINDKFYIMR
jgi:hypothetical protein